MTLELRSEFAQRAYQGAPLRGGYGGNAGYSGTVYGTLSPRSLTGGIKDQIKNLDDQVLNLFTQGEPELKQKLGKALAFVGLYSPQQRVRGKIQEMEGIISKYDGIVNKREREIGDSIRDSKRFQSELGTVEADCLFYEGLTKEIATEHDRLEGEERKLEANLKKAGNNPAQSSVLGDLQRVRMEKEALSHDLAETENHLDNATAYRDTIDVRLSAIEGNRVMIQEELDQVRTQRLDLYRIVEHIKVNVEKNPSAGLVSTLELMQKGGSVTDLGSKILTVYLDAREETRKTMEKIPQAQAGRWAAIDERLAKSRESNKKYRAERMQRIRERNYSMLPNGSVAGSAGGSNAGSGSSSVSFMESAGGDNPEPSQQS